MSIQLQQDIVNFLKKKADQSSESKKAASDNLFSSDLKEKLKEFGLEVNTEGKGSGKDQKGNSDAGKDVRKTRLKNGMKVSLKLDKAKLGGEEKKSAELVQKLNKRQDNSSGAATDSKSGNQKNIITAKTADSEKVEEGTKKDVKTSRENLRVKSDLTVEKKDTSGKSKLTENSVGNSAKVNSTNKTNPRISVSELKGESGKSGKEVQKPDSADSKSKVKEEQGNSSDLKTRTGGKKAEASGENSKLSREVKAGLRTEKPDSASADKTAAGSKKSAGSEGGVTQLKPESGKDGNPGLKKSQDTGLVNGKSASASSDKTEPGERIKADAKKNAINAGKSAEATKATIEKSGEKQKGKVEFKQDSSVKADNTAKRMGTPLNEKEAGSEKRDTGKTAESTRKVAENGIRNGDVSQKRGPGVFSGTGRENVTKQSPRESGEIKKTGNVGRQQDNGVLSSRLSAKEEKISEQQKPESGELFKSKVKEVEKEEGRGRRTPLNNDRARLSYDRQAAGAEQTRNTGSGEQSSAQQTGNSAFRESAVEVNSKGGTGKTFGSLEFDEVQEKGSDQKDEAKISDPKATDRLQQTQNQFAYMRREVTGKVVEIARTFQSSSSQNQDGWQRQRIQLGNGQSLDVAIRQSGGKINIQLGSLSSEIAKLLQTNIMDLKAHLENQLSSEVELEFEMQGEQQGAPDENAAPFPGEGLADIEENSAISDSDTESTAPRFMGTNNNEWTG